MKTPIEFYFDFSSPYGYFASEKIDDMGARHGRAVNWHPVLLGVVFKQTGAIPLTQIPVKGNYSLRDFARTARHMGVPFNMPPTFPIPSQAPARVMLWIAGDRGTAGGPPQDEATPRALAAKAFARTAYRAYFVDGVDISKPEAAADIAGQLGHDRNAALAAIDDPVWKNALKTEVEQAIAAGVFGSPFIVVDGEPFWGADRLSMAEEWLKTGGW